MHFSRSPFIAFAVTAMIGRSFFSCSLRISRIVVMPSMSGIMMSISTMSMVGSSFTRRIASRPLFADTICIPWSCSTVESAKMLRMSSSTISAFLPSSTRLELCSRSTARRSSGDRPATLRCRKK